MTSARARVLIVDDNADDLATYSRWLLRCSERQFTVTTASSLATALETCTTFKPDCILLDYDLREATGLDFMAELSRRGNYPPVVVMTGNGSESVAVEFMKAGARDYLNKAVLTAQDLCGAIGAQLSAQATRIELARYRERERHANAELSAALSHASFLAETGKRFAATLDYGETLELIGARALPFLADVCIIDLIEAGVLYRRSVQIDATAGLAAVRGTLAQYAPDVDAPSGVARAIATDASVHVSGAELAEAARDDVDIADLRRAGLAAAAFVPMRYSGRTIGVLTFGTLRAAGYSSAERSLLDDFAQRAAVAIANARSVESERLSREQAEAAKRRLSFQSRVSALFSRSLDWENTLSKLTKIVTTSFSDTAAIFLLDQAKGHMRLVAASAQTPELERLIVDYYRMYPPHTSDRAGTGHAAHTGRAEFYADDLREVIAELRLGGQRAQMVADWSPVSTISVPLAVKGGVIGALMLARDRSDKRFRMDDLTVAEDLARRTATYIENARLYEREHAIASTLQQTLLPDVLPSIPDLLFAVRYFAGADGMDVGGDWYDIIEVGDGRVVITIGDVVGRGVMAAAAMGQYRNILRAYAFEHFGPAASLSRLNDLVHGLGGEQFATCTVIVLDRGAHRLQYASAGHPPAMLRLPSGRVAVLDGAASMPIGAWPSTRYIEASADMPVGATLVLYTDGLVETRHRSAAEGVEVLQASLERGTDDIEMLIEDVLHDVAPDRSDDIAVLAIQMLPQESATLKRWVYQRVDRAAVQTIRAGVDEMLEQGASEDSDVFGARLIVGELLSNIVRHAPGPVRVELSWAGEFPELRVYDNGPGFPLRETFDVPEDILSMTGRGLFLISQISKNFKITRRPAGGLSTRVVLPVRRTAEEREHALR